ncbi:thiolase family protein [Pseudonocardia sp.]|jgi:acetyl-CoA acetyltransferase family protein|uniref:thiolase family protein n=1 Tax=Pseudonocardia sp. TaxID=60912 RepID=UPI00260F9426|nr:thiolase family protein [Pseudonocardia sp.]MCW2716744.1 fadA 2 [Pseudonocardia sp.]
MTQAVIVDAVRSPVGRGRPNGALATVHPVELLAQVLTALVERNDLDPGLVEDVIIGCVSQAGEQATTPGRMAWLAAGYPVEVPSTTIDRRCGSSQQAAHFAAQGVLAGAYDIVIAGGVESMSQVPLASARLGKDTFGPSVTTRFAPGLVGQGISAELVAAKWGQGRERLDAYSVQSHVRAHDAATSGVFAGEITPIRRPDGQLVTADETIRPDSSLERMAELPSAFRSEEMTARFPEIEWRITAGNSSSIADGASAVLIMSEKRAQELGLRPRARFHSFAVCGDDPVLMLTGPIPATQQALRKGLLDIGDIGHFEVNEAFAPVPLMYAAEFGIDEARLNPLGGAIALGHPLGSSGTRLITTMLSGMEATGERWGLVTMCEGGGMANATIIERL